MPGRRHRGSRVEATEALGEFRFIHRVAPKVLVRSQLVAQCPAHRDALRKCHVAALPKITARVLGVRDCVLQPGIPGARTSGTWLPATTADWGFWQLVLHLA